MNLSARGWRATALVLLLAGGISASGALYTGGPGDGYGQAALNTSTLLERAIYTGGPGDASTVSALNIDRPLRPPGTLIFFR
jgi:hypothetical protein